MEAKEKKKEKSALKENRREAPPTPATPARTRGAGATDGDVLPVVIAVNKPPTLNLLLSFAHIRCNFFDDEFTREWFRIMNDEYMWCYPETGTPIRHWPAYFRLWRVKEKLFAKLNDPNRIPDARSGKSPRRADNWIGTPAERMDNVLG